MKRNYIYIYSIIIGLSLILSCQDKEHLLPGFKDQITFSIFDYIKKDSTEYSYFIKILRETNVDKILSSYNPYNDGYTCFLPNNKAIEKFIEKSNRFKSLNELLNDTNYLNEFCRFHIVSKAYKSDDFPFGALPDYTLSKDLLSMGFVVKPDTAYYVINNQSTIIKLNIETSNGYIHLIDEALMPIAFTMYQWLEQNKGFSIFKKAIDTTGFVDLLNKDFKLKNVTGRKITLLLEPDSIYNKNKIYSINDLIKKISPDRNDFTNNFNPLYNFIGYHILAGDYFLDDFQNNATNYITYSDIPININGKGMDIKINLGKEKYDTIINGNDTTYIDYVGFIYDQSNIVTKTGVIHLIDKVNKQQTPSRAIQTFEFFEEPVFNEYRQEVGENLIEDSSSLNVIKYKGADLMFVKAPENTINAWNNDYLMIDGNFVISYTIPSIIQGEYTIKLQAEAYNTKNAVIQVYIDNKKIGSLINLATGGSSASPFYAFELGKINFIKYEQHIVEIRSLIPGRFLWDYIRFEPI